MAKTSAQLIYRNQSSSSSIPSGGRVAAGGVALPAVAGGMEVLKAAGRGVGDLLGIMAKEYRGRQAARVEDAVLFANEEYERWKTRYMEANRGADAMSAQAEFAAAYEEIAKRTFEEYGGARDEVFGGELKRQLLRGNLYALKEGGKYQVQERDEWDRSRLSAQEAAFADLCANNPEDADRIEFEREELLARYERAHRGEDIGEFKSRLNRAEFQARADSFLANEDEAGLRGMIESRGVDTGKMGGDVKELIREAAARHGVPENLALAVAMQESGGNQGAVSKAGAIGVMQLMPGTARELGVDPHDLRQNIEGGMRYLARMRQQTENWEEALYSYNMGPGGYRQVKAGKREMPEETRKYAPAILKRMGQARYRRPDAQKLQERLNILRDKKAHEQELAQKQAEEQRLANMIDEYRGMYQKIADMPMERKQAIVYRYLDAIENPDDRGKLARVMHSQLEYDNRKQKAYDAESAYNVVSDIISRRLSPMEARIRLSDQKARLSPNARAMAEKMLFPQDPKPNMANLKALETGMLLIDQGKLQSEEERRFFAVNNSLSHTQYRDLMKYKGKAGSLSYTRLLQAAHAVKFPLPKKEDPQFLQNLYQAVVADLPDGQPASTADIQKILASYIMRGNVPSDWFGFTTYGEAVGKGLQNEWLPTITEDEHPALDAQLRQLNHKTNDHNRKKVKKLMFGRKDNNDWKD